MTRINGRKRSAKPVKPVDPREAARIGPRQLKDPRSVEYAWQTISLLKSQYRSSQVLADMYLNTLKEAEQHEIFKRVPPDAPYGSLDNLLKAELGVDRTESIERKTAQQRSQEAAQATTGAVLPNDGSVNQHQGSQFTTPSQASRAKVNGVSKRQQERLDALAVKAPALLEKVRAGEMSTHRACVEAGIIKVKSVEEQILALWSKLSAAERRALLKELK